MSHGKTLVLAVALASCPWLADAAAAQRQGARGIPRPADASTASAPLEKQPVAVADLSCSLTLSKDKDGLMPIPNGGRATFVEASNPPGSFSQGTLVYLHRTLRNEGYKATSGFAVTEEAWEGGTVIGAGAHPKTLAPLAGGEVRALPVTSFALYEGVHTRTFKLHMDVGGDVVESNEFNNICRVLFIADVQVGR